MANREEKNKFSIMIIETAMKTKMNHMDTITSYCEINNFEVEVAAGLINDSLKELIRGEAQTLKYRCVPKVGNKLPI